MHDEAKVPKHAVALADEEKEQAKRRAEREEKLMSSLEKFLSDNNVTMGEMNNILRRFNARNEAVITSLTVKEIIERHR